MNEHDELKDNKCLIRFMCNYNEFSRCSLRTVISGTPNWDCLYRTDFSDCISDEAKVNRMTLELEKKGFKVIKDE